MNLSEREDACDGCIFSVAQNITKSGCNKAMNYLLKRNDARIVASVLKRPPSEITQRI